MSLHKITVLLALLLPACNLYDNCASARSVTEALQKNSTEREARTINVMRAMIEARMTSVRERLRSEFERSVATLRVRVRDKIEAKRVELSTKVKTDISTALDPVLNQLNTELLAAKQVQGEGAPRLREYTLAAQQASTMAVAQHETFELIEEVDKQLAALRTEMDNTITALATQAQAEVVPGLEDQVNALEAQLKSQSEQYLAEINGAHEQLRRYFDCADAPGLFFSGLAKGIGWNLDGLSDKADQLLQKGRTALGAWVDKATNELENTVATKVTSFISEAASKVRNKPK